MNNFFKRFFGIPIEWSNIALVKGIQILIDTYGKRLLKIDTDKIIDFTECGADYNVLHTKPLDLNELQQIIGNNNITIHSTHISSISIIFPRTNIQTRYTTIKINSISMSMFMSRLDLNAMFKSLDLTSSYYLHQTVEQENSLQDICSKIKYYLLKIPKLFEVKIDNIACVLNESLNITFSGVSYKNDELYIDKISITSMEKDMEFVTIKSISYNNHTKKDPNMSGQINILSIDSIKIDSKLCEYLPTYYTSTTSDLPWLKITIGTLSIDRLYSNNICVCIEPSNIIISGVNIIYPNLFSINVSNNMTFDPITRILYVPSVITIDIINMRKTMILTEYYKKCFGLISDAIIEYTEEDIIDGSSNNTYIHNLCVCCNFALNTYSFTIDSIGICTDTVLPTYILKNIGVCLPENHFNISKLTKYPDNIYLEEIFWHTSSNTDVHVSSVDIRSNFVDDTNINICNLHLSDPVAIYHIVRDAIHKINLPESSNKHPHKLSVNISDTIINYTNDSHKFALEISKGHIVKHDFVEIYDSDAIVYVDGNVLTRLNGINWSGYDIVIERTDINIDKKLPSIIYNLINMFPSDNIPTNAEPSVIICGLDNTMSNLVESYWVENYIASCITDQLDISVYVPELTECCSRKFIDEKSITSHIIIDEYQPTESPSASTQSNIKITHRQIYIDIYDDSDVNILCVFFKNVVVDLINILSANHQIALGVETGGVIDKQTKNTEWKHIAIFSKYNMCDIKLDKIDSKYNLTCSIQPFKLNVRQKFIQEFKMWKYEPHLNKTQSDILPIRKIIIGEIHCNINYKPLVRSDMFNISNYTILLPKISIDDIYTLEDIKQQLKNKWYSQLNINILDLIGHINIISPYKKSLRKISNIITDFTS